MDRESAVGKEIFWKTLKKKILTKVSGITIPSWESYFQGLFITEKEISDDLLDEQILGNDHYFFQTAKVPNI